MRKLPLIVLSAGIVCAVPGGAGEAMWNPRPAGEGTADSRPAFQGGVWQTPPSPLGQDLIIRIPRKKKDRVNMGWLLEHPALFQATREDFEKQYPKGTYTWLDREKSRCRFSPDHVDIELRSEEEAKCGETIVSFKDDKISGVLISVVNKGDDGLIKKGPYQEAIKKATTVLNQISGVKPEPRKKNETISKAEGLVWPSKKAMYMMEHLWVPEEIRDGFIWYEHGEFVRIRLLPPQVLLGMQQNTFKVSVSRQSLAKRVKREGSKVWLEGVPMVDQGSKGYCAVATFERVMRYYGSQVDMHDLADLANSSFMGTRPEALKDAVHKMAVRTGLRTREPVYMEGKHYLSMANSYNREAKKTGDGGIDIDGIRDLSELYQKMDPKIALAVRTRDSGYNKFASEVAKSINAGIPMMWALQLGMFWEDKLEESYEANRFEDGDSSNDAEEEEERKKERESRPERPPEYMAGGHMRLIVGYDPKEKVIYYSDSWGPGHEMKKMSLEEAWTVTMAVFLLEP